MARIKAVSIDWENTCSTGKNLPWPTHKLGDLSQILRMLWKIEGIPFFLNTGRQAPYAEAALQCLGIITNTPSIAENGSFLYYPGTGRFKTNPAITEEKRIAFARIYDMLCGLVSQLGGLEELGKKYCFSTNPPQDMPMSDYFGCIKEKITKKSGDAIWEKIEITHSQSAVDITITGVNKRTGLQFWCDDQKISVDELAGIGDSRGDWPVLEVVALPMCPANATQETKELILRRGGYVSPFPTTLGVIDCVANIAQDPLISSIRDEIIRKWEMQFPVEFTGMANYNFKERRRK